jgi:hypothetical protein
MKQTNLADLDFDALAAQMVAIAQHGRKLAVEGDVVQLHDLLEEVRVAANAAGGERLALLEVAEAFLRAMARSDLGRSELALRRMFAEHPEISEALFTRLLKPATLMEEELLDKTGEARGQIQELIDLGVLRRVGKMFDVRPSLRTLARDLLEPAAFRMWRRVNDTRAEIQRAKMKPPEASGHLAAKLGITMVQASAHLESHPIRQTLRLIEGLAGQQRVPVTPGTMRTSVLYRRDQPAEPNFPTTPTVTPSGQGMSPTSSLVSGATRQGFIGPMR